MNKDEAKANPLKIKNPIEPTFPVGEVVRKGHTFNLNGVAYIVAYSDGRKEIRCIALGKVPEKEEEA